MSRMAGFNLTSVLATAFLLFFLPVASKFRSPDGVEGGWYDCVFAAFGLLLLDLWGSKSSGKRNRRVGYGFIFQRDWP
ncbi:hypothetical protein IAD21_04583 [Abditibacteriota bacterium]|nr:hypothetical protein IAD21_04583 [Abditibacteriota bacterium]